MISGLVLKDLNGVCFVICGFYKYTLLASTEFNLTVPGQDMEAAIESETFSPEDERVTYRNDADMTLNHRKSRL
jgi:hypothetical protein